MRARSALPLLGALALGAMLPLAASAQATVDEPPPSCEDVIELAVSHRPSAALVAAAQVEAAGEAPCDATVLGEAEESVAEAAVHLRRAQGLDAEAARVGAGTDAASELRGAADTAYAQALALDLGLTAAFDGLSSDPGSEAPQADAAEVAARLVALGYRAAAQELLVTAVTDGEVDPEQLDQALQDLLAPSPPETVVDWWDEEGKTWLTVGAWFAAAAAVVYLVLWTWLRRPPYQLVPPAQAVTAGKADGVADAWAELLPRRLDDLVDSTPGMRLSTGPDTDLALPDIDGMPSGFTAVVKFWTWFRRLRVRHVSTLLHDEGGKVGVTVSIRKRSGRPLKIRTLRPLDDAAPVDRKTYLDLLPQAAAWIAFQTTKERDRAAVLGTASEDAVLRFADSGVHHAAGDRGAARRALLRSRSADPEMLAAWLNLAVLDLSRPDDAPAVVPVDWRQRLSTLRAVEEAAVRRLTTNGTLESHVLPAARDRWRREAVRCRATIMRARYNRVISLLNWGAVDSTSTLGEPVEVRKRLRKALKSTRAATEDLLSTTPSRGRWTAIRDTAHDVRRHVDLMERGHLDPGPTAFLDELKKNLVEIDQEWASAFPDVLPVWVDYGIACIASTRAPDVGAPCPDPTMQEVVDQVQEWLDRAFAKAPKAYTQAARHDPFFARLLSAPTDPSTCRPVRARRAASRRPWIARIRGASSLLGRLSRCGGRPVTSVR
ncbi:hypothetical protein [Oerskovia turbata]|uniref:hypothetical protein n=1 Tax=Oerskovia turbata TaxID=1713 RepID=UPI0013E93224|nr:hypothetical protein [Oerskovia turbata]